MEIIELTIDGVDYVQVIDGEKITSMTKAHYEELEAAKEVKADEAETK